MTRHRTVPAPTARLALLANALLALLALPAAAAKGPLFELPSPTGPYPVGIQSWHAVDESRTEDLAPPGAKAGKREIEVRAWYPAAPGGGAVAPYLREGLPEAQAFARLLQIPDAFDGLAKVVTHARLDAPPSPDGKPFPILLFSHGLTAIPSSYTALLEDLASHGFVVLSVVHPYEATAALLSNGKAVTMLDPAGKLIPPIQGVLQEWGAEDKTMAEITALPDVEARLDRMRAYLSGLKQTGATLSRWVRDLQVVLNQFLLLPLDSPGGKIAARADYRRIGVFGHSMGGVTAGQFCVEDGRCRAGLNLDGIPQYGTMIDHNLERPFLMVYSARPGRTGASDDIYRRSALLYDRVDVRDTLHLDFSDMVFWGSALGSRPMLGKLPPARAVDLTRKIVREYFRRELNGKPSAFLAGTANEPEVKVQRFLREKPVPKAEEKKK